MMINILRRGTLTVATMATFVASGLVVSGCMPTFYHRAGEFDDDDSGAYGILQSPCIREDNPRQLNRQGVAPITEERGFGIWGGLSALDGHPVDLYTVEFIPRVEVASERPMWLCTRSTKVASGLHAATFDFYLGQEYSDSIFHSLYSFRPPEAADIKGKWELAYSAGALWDVKAGHVYELQLDVNVGPELILSWAEKELDSRDLQFIPKSLEGQPFIKFYPAGQYNRRFWPIRPVARIVDKTDGEILLFGTTDGSIPPELQE